MTSVGDAPDRIPRNLRILLAANFVSVLGSGLTLPFLLIYLHEVRHISLGITGLLIGGTSLISIPVGPATGVLVDKFGPRVVCATALIFDAAGAIGLIYVRSPLSALPVMLIYGLANGSTWPAWQALFAVMVTDVRLRPRVFARSFQLLNLGLGIGSVTAGVVVHVGHPRSFELIYFIDGITYLSVVAALVLLPASAFARPKSEPHEFEPVGGYREVFSDRRFVRYLVASALLMFAGYAAVNTGLVGYATVVVHAPTSVIAWAFGINTGLIVAVQPFALRVTERLRRTTALSICALFFAAAWVILLVAGFFPRTTEGYVLTASMFGVFALGEMLLAPVGAPLVTMLARHELQGRYNATSSTVFTATSILCPPLAGALLGAGLGDVFLVILLAFCGCSIIAFQWLRRSLSPEIDNAPRSERVPALEH